MFTIKFKKPVQIDQFEAEVAEFVQRLEAEHGPVEYQGIVHCEDGVHFEVVYKKV